MNPESYSCDGMRPAMTLNQEKKVRLFAVKKRQHLQLYSNFSQLVQVKVMNDNLTVVTMHSWIL
jgi:hypothetical protein